MKINNFVRWQPCDNLAKKYSLDTIINNSERLRFVLTNCANMVEKICVDFDLRVYSYKKTNLLHSDSKLKKLCQENETDFLDWTFFKVLNSSYVKWVSESSCDMFGLAISQHIVFVASNAIVEIIPHEDPTITFFTVVDKF